MPKISVILPVYNASAFLARTLDSILYQTYSDFEVIAINDGSTDGSLEILRDYEKRDSRITVVDQKNEGLVATLNKAANLAKGEYLARMDSDDLSLPRRFELQVEAFEKNPHAVLCAGCFDVINEDDDVIYHERVPSQKEELFRALFVRNPIAHGSVMFKKSVFEKVGGYSDECGPTEDYELWSRLVEHGDLISVPATIFRWRINPGGITQTKADIMNRHMKENIRRFTARHEMQPVKRSYLRKRGRFYVHSSELHGVDMKETMLKDCISIAIAFAKNGHYLRAILQLLVVSSTGRTGVRLTLDRIKHTTKHHINN